MTCIKQVNLDTPFAASTLFVGGTMTWLQSPLYGTGGRLVAKKVTLASLATSVGTLLRVNVVDVTGIKGYYAFDFRWSAPPDAPRTEPGLGPEGQALVITAVKDEFGLRFSSERGPVHYWIVDHVEPPTEN